MDPFTALGAAGTIATFIHMSYKLISSTYSTYESVSGMANDDEQLGFVIEQLSRLSGSMAKPTLDENDAEMAMSSVALRCHSLSIKLLEILRRSQTQDLHSLRQSAIAALRSKWHDKEKTELKKQIDDCQECFHLQLSVMMRTDMIKSLDKLSKIGKANENELAALRRHVLVLQRGVTLSHIGKGAADELANLFQLSNSALKSITGHLILENLTFPEMRQRYGTVAKAHSETFQWIFEVNPRKKPKALEGRTLFTTWLESGSGIFHIAGKPGSGKSTLMKFLYKNEKTKHLLNSWAAGRKLVIGKYFFSRSGGNMENSTTGLLQTLLYEVLEQCLELVPHVFPKEWVRFEDLPWPISLKLHLDGDDLSEAFDRLIEHRNLYEDRCFFFMVDALDEFHETYVESYKQLNTLLSSWTTKASEIKLCVSSREPEVFMDHFRGPQGLKLQDLTEDDIYKYVKEKLESNSNFLDMEKPNNGADELISQIILSSNGVFLWVSLVVKLLDDACDEGDAFEELQRKIEFMPREMEDLFDQLFGSIHESDRHQSAQTFAIMLKLMANKYGLRFSLLRYSFLEEYKADPNFASMPDFVSQGYLVEDEGALNARLKRGRKQLYKCCKGLLEVIESDDDPLDNDDDDPPGRLEHMPLNQRISLVHGLALEYLEREDISKDIIARTQGFNVSGAVVQTYVAELVSLNLRQPGCDDICYGSELEEIFNYVSKIESEALSHELIAALHNLNKTRQNQEYKKVDFIAYGRVNSSLPCMDNKFAVAHCAAFFGCHKYFTASESSSAHLLNKYIENGSLALVAIRKLRAGTTILRWLFQHGCSPNQAVLMHSSGSLWLALLSQTIFRDKFWDRPKTAEAILIFLEFGANPDMSFMIVDGESDDKSKKVRVLPPPPIGISTIDSSYRFISEYIGKDTDLFEFVCSKGGRVTLRDFIEHEQPPQMDSILSLVDRNLRAPQAFPGTISDGAGHVSVGSSQQEDEEKAAGDEQIQAELGADPVPSGQVTSTIFGRCTVTEVVTRLTEVIRNPLATFFLGKNTS